MHSCGFLFHQMYVQRCLHLQVKCYFGFAIQLPLDLSVTTCRRICNFPQRFINDGNGPPYIGDELCLKGHCRQRINSNRSLKATLINPHVPVVHRFDRPSNLTELYLGQNQIRSLPMDFGCGIRHITESYFPLIASVVSIRHLLHMRFACLCMYVDHAGIDTLY